MCCYLLLHIDPFIACLHVKFRIRYVTICQIFTLVKLESQQTTWSKLFFCLAENLRTISSNKTIQANVQFHRLDSILIHMGKDIYSPLLLLKFLEKTETKMVTYFSPFFEMPRLNTSHLFPGTHIGMTALTLFILKGCIFPNILKFWAYILIIVFILWFHRFSLIQAIVYK